MNLLCNRIVCDGAPFVHTDHDQNGEAINPTPDMGTTPACTCNMNGAEDDIGHFVGCPLEAKQETK